MNIFAKTFTYLLLFTSLFLNLAHAKDAPMPPAGGFPGMPQMSQEEMQQLEQELAALNEMMKGMSEEEQAQFLDAMVQEAMEEVKKDLSDEGKELLDKLEGGDISDEDFNKLLNELMPAEEAKKEEKPAKPAPTAKVEPKLIITSKHQEALDRINSLINRTNLIIQKASSIPELPGTIHKWHREKKIEWQPKLKWNEFRKDLDSFVSLLEQLKEQDPKTQQYKHLDELLKDETLYNNLSKIEKVAVEYEPQLVEIAPIGRPTIPEDSKKALQKILTQYNEALYVLKVREALKSLFTKFEPTAKALREAEEKAKEAAAQELKKGRAPGRTVVGGFPEAEYIPAYEEPYEEYYPDASGPREVYIPTYEPPKQDSFLPTSRSVQPSGAERPSGKEAQKAAKGSQKEKEEEYFPRIKDEQVKLPSTKVSADKTRRAVPETIKIGWEPVIEKIVEQFKQVDALVKNNDLLSKDLKKEVAASGTYSKTLVDKLLPDLDAALRQIQRSIDQFNELIKNMPTNQKKAAKKQLNTAIQKPLETIKKLNGEINSIIAAKDTLSLEKLYLYLTDNMSEYIGLQFGQLIVNDTEREEFADLYSQNEGRVSGLPTVVSAYIAVKNITDPLKTQLTDLATQIVDQYQAISTEVYRPTRLPEIKRVIEQIQQSIG